MRREAEALADNRRQDRRFAGYVGRSSFLAGAVEGVKRAHDRLHDMLRAADFSELRGLALTWFTILGVAIGTAGVLQALGPPPAGRAGTVAAKTSSSPSITALLSRVGEAVTNSRDGAPPGGDVAEALQKVAAALPSASPEDRRLANYMASSLYDRAKVALDAGKIDEEQRWIALASILAPPPDLAPTEPQRAPQPPPEAGGRPSSEPVQDVTPNEAEAEANTPRPRAHLPTASPPADLVMREPSSPHGGSPSNASAPAEAAPDASPSSAVPAQGESSVDQQPAPADRAERKTAELPALQPPGAAPPTRAMPQPDAANPEPAELPSTSGTAGTIGPNPGIAIHFPAGSQPAEARAKILADRLGGDVGPAATQSTDDVPPGAIIRYAGPADHRRAREIGEMLGSMGYAWRMQRSPNAQGSSGAPSLDIWLPATEPGRRATEPRYVSNARRRAWFSFRFPLWF